MFEHCLTTRRTAVVACELGRYNIQTLLLSARHDLPLGGRSYMVQDTTSFVKEGLKTIIDKLVLDLPLKRNSLNLSSHLHRELLIDYGSPSQLLFWSFLYI